MTRRTVWRIAAWMGIAGVLAVVALAYSQPSLMQQLGNAFWSCF